jgi:hypothetical protein
MGQVKAARLVELSASILSWGQGGSPRAASAIGRWSASWSVPFPPTDEETAGRRRSEVYVWGPRGEARVNNGRGERIFDAVVCSPLGAHVEYVPASFKCGDSRDITTDIKLARALVAAGAPIWVYHIAAPRAADVDYTDGVRVDIPMVEPECMTMRRVNITPVIQDLLKSWEVTLGDADARGEVVFLRRHTVKSPAGKAYDYPRLRVRLGSIPARYWLDKEPIPFDAQAVLPSAYPA